MESATDRPAGLFTGWRVVAGVFGLMAIACGLGFYNASVYLQVMVADRGISVVAASGASATFFVTFGLAGVPISRWLTDRDPRPIILGGGVIGGLALLGLTAATSAWQLYASFAVFGLAFAAVSFVPGTTLITRWFVRQRALALTVATTGLSVGGIVITPASAAAIERSGLDAVGPWLALGWTAGIVLVTVVAIRPSPQALGLEPDGDPRPPGGSAPVTGMAPGAAYRTRTFQLLTAGVTLMMLTQIGALAHLYPIGLERADARTAALAVTTVAASSIVGRFLGVWVLRHLDALRFTILLGGMQAVAMGMLVLDTGGVGVLLAVAVFGLAVGNLLVLVPVVIVETFGAANYPSIYAMIQLVSTLGIASGPILFGAVRQASGGYALGALSAAAISLVAAAVLIVAARARSLTPVTA
jgi:MFS family permease